MKSALRVTVLLCATLVATVVQPPTPLGAAPSGLKTPAPLLPLAVAYCSDGGSQSSCEDGCAADREACLASGVCGSQIYCEVCEEQYNSCMASCSGSCPSTTTNTSSSSFTWYPQEYVCVGSGMYGSLHRKAQVTMQTTTTTTTHYCDGSTSQNTNTTYNDLYCYYYDTGSTCFWPDFNDVPYCF